MRRNKFGAVKQTIDGFTFDSQIEARRYGQLKMLQAAGEISHLRVHGEFPKFKLVVNGVKISEYAPDFMYCDESGAVICEDVKGRPTRTRDYIIRKKLMLALHGIEIIEWPKRE